MLRYDPKLPADASVAHRSAAPLSALAPNRLKQRIATRCKAQRKEQPDRRVEQIFLQCVDDPMFHLRSTNTLMAISATSSPESPASPLADVHPQTLPAYTTARTRLAQQSSSPICHSPVSQQSKPANPQACRPAHVR